MTDDFRIFPLGIDALTIDFGNFISEKLNERVISLAEALNKDPFDGMLEVVPAYSSLTVFYDVCRIAISPFGESTVFDRVAGIVGAVARDSPSAPSGEPRLIEISVDFSPESGPDLGLIADMKQLSVSEVVEIFVSRTYRVFMLGFLPGFPYMGEIDDRIAVPRRETPRTRVERGSVGIAGRQTGVYPLASPGGWQIVGKTEFELFTPEKENPTALRPGDRVKFVAI